MNTIDYTVEGVGGIWECLIIAVSDEATALTTGVKVTFYMPYAMT